MGKVEERCRVDRVVVCEESLIWFEGMPVVVGDEPMATGFLCLLYVFELKYNVLIDMLHKMQLTKFR